MGRTFDTYHDFASSTLDQIYEPDDLASALHLVANCFESGIYRNNGDGTFTWEDLPHEAQRSPCYSAAPIDIDADGYIDLAITQNFFTMQAETGLMRGGMGVVLRGNAGGGFEAVPPDESGFIVFGDGKALAVLDADHDGRPDLLAIQNNDRPVLMTDSGYLGRGYLRVRLVGPASNPTAVGARVTAAYQDGHTQTHLFAANAGYLTQSAAHAFIAHPPSNPIVSLAVTWPDGSVTEPLAVDPGDDNLSITQPGAE